MNYFSAALENNDRKVIIKEAVKQLADVDFTHVVCRGVSGLSVGAVVAYLLNKQLFVVRKVTESSHQGTNPAYAELGKNPRGVIIDDFVSSGKTLSACVEVASKVNDITIVGYYLYLSGTDSHLILNTSTNTITQDYRRGHIDLATGQVVLQRFNRKKYRNNNDKLRYKNF
jgi:adenine/guanine phosphoribosyltransferase-like PRPP-binding protein